MVYLYIFVMAFVTYLLRAVPLTVFRKKIENRFLCSFLYYVPYACLTALTIPAIFSATESVISAVAGLGIAVVLGFRGKSLFTVAASACITVLVCNKLITNYKNISLCTNVKL